MKKKEVLNPRIVISGFSGVLFVCPGVFWCPVIPAGLSRFDAPINGWYSSAVRSRVVGDSAVYIGKLVVWS